MSYHPRMDEKQITTASGKVTGRLGTAKGKAHHYVLMDAHGVQRVVTGLQVHESPTIVVKDGASGPTQSIKVVEVMHTSKASAKRQLWKHWNPISMKLVASKSSSTTKGARIKQFAKASAFRGKIIVIDEFASMPAIADLGRYPASEPAPIERVAVTDFKGEAARLGIPLGTAPTDEEARTRLRIVAADARDIFATPDAGMPFLTEQPLDSRGRNGVQILREKGLPGILSALDHKRFGTRG